MHTQTPIMNQYTNSLPLNQMILTLVQRYNNIQLYKFSKQSNKIDSQEEGISNIQAEDCHPSPLLIYGKKELWNWQTHLTNNL